MFGIIGDLFNAIFGSPAATASSVQTALNKIASAFKTLYTYLHTIFGLLRGQWPRVARSTLFVVNSLTSFMTATFQRFIHIEHQEIPFIERWITWLGGTLRIAINIETRRRVDDVNLARRQAHNYTHSVLWWVIVHVLGFLYKILSGVLGWIARIGSTMWYYFSHLDKFAELLFWHIITALERFAWDAAKRLGTFFLALIVHNVVRFATLVESIIVAVLG